VGEFPYPPAGPKLLIPTIRLFPVSTAKNVLVAGATATFWTPLPPATGPNVDAVQFPVPAPNDPMINWALLGMKIGMTKLRGSTQAETLMS